MKQLQPANNQLTLLPTLLLLLLLLTLQPGTEGVGCATQCNSNNNPPCKTTCSEDMVPDNPDYPDYQDHHIFHKIQDYFG